MIVMTAVTDGETLRTGELGARQVLLKGEFSLGKLADAIVGALPAGSMVGKVSA